VWDKAFGTFDMSDLTSLPNPTSEQDLRVLLDNAPDAIGRFDRQLRHVYVNEATARANARPVSDFPGKTMGDLGHTPEVCDLIDTNVRGVFETGEERTIELLFQGPLRDSHFQCRMAPEFDSEGSVKYVLVVSRDISEQRRAEAALVEAGKRAVAANIAAQLSHEINNPLAVLTNSIYLLERNESLDEQARMVVEIMSSNLDRITSLSQKILSVSSSPESRPEGSEAESTAY
jgi:PAS domain S-box-containing protein